jgi:hypothetical protein
VVILKGSRVENLNAGVMLAIEGRMISRAASLLGVIRIVEPKTEVIELDGINLSAGLRLRKDCGRTLENVRRRQSLLRNDEGLSVETANEIANPIAVYIGLNVTNIPGKPKGRVRDLDGKQVKTRVRREGP